MGPRALSPVHHRPLVLLPTCPGAPSPSPGFPLIPLLHPSPPPTSLLTFVLSYLQTRQATSLGLLINLLSCNQSINQLS